MKIGEKGIVKGGAFLGFNFEVIGFDRSGAKCKVDVFGKLVEISIPVCDLTVESDALREFIKDMSPSELKTLRSMINGKLSKRAITPGQQAKMQAGRGK